MSLLILLGLFLVSKGKSREKGFGWIGVFFLLFALNFLDGILLLRGTYLGTPRLAFWEDALVFAYGPLIYFFSLRIKKDSLIRKPGLLLHFLPFVLMELAVLVFHLSYSRQEVQDLLNIIVSQSLDSLSILGMIPIFIHLFAYILLARHTLKKHQDYLKQHFSNLELSWAFSLIRMVLFIFLFSLMSTMTQYLGSPRIYSLVLLILILISIFLTLRIYNG